MTKQSPQARRLVRGVILAIAALFVGFVIYRTTQIPTYECEVCITFRGNSICRTVQGATTAEARSGAITNACALLSSGVTDTLACERTTPTKLQCREFAD
jgi:hypothetical protein